ncbi:D-glycerate dehydrogenase [Geobacillus sp. C56-T2]|uniref:2-hydroxyacid dehydrogenase n=1 Tax=Geobacillus sp. C56-T2 TaxID=600773 RepID=UPI0011AAC70F|nr:D-glycerate dehydrogenase [Geobacillus sp. C56-T2]NNV06588.1 D-glycerate dehydrogenase [Geobacillus sp. MMMUD3]TWG31714.1 glyoxylate reductase [Geobacillus sp. C56-T2]
MTKPCVFITRKLPEDVVAPLSAIAEVEMWPHEDVAVPSDVLVEKAKRAAALLPMVSDPIGEQVLSAGAELKVVANMGVGYDNIDVPAATRRGIVVCNTPNVLTDTTADLTFALLLATARRLVEAAEFLKEGKWKSWSPFLLAGADVHHKTIGIVGMGNIGQAVAKRAKGFDMNVLYYNRSRRPEAEVELGAIYRPFFDLLAESDFVVCLTPLTPETRRLFNREAFRRMKRSAVFINAARGAVVDEQALYEALVHGEIAAAGLDVFEKEPVDPAHPLVSLPNVVALPHIGSATYETRRAMMALARDNIIAVLEGRPPLTPVNRPSSLP